MIRETGVARYDNIHIVQARQLAERPDQIVDAGVAIVRQADRLAAPHHVGRDRVDGRQAAVHGRNPPEVDGRSAERDASQRNGLPTDERQRLKDLGREMREPKRAHEDPTHGR